MIPVSSAFLQEDFEYVEQPTHTYRLDMQSERISGHTDGQEAMKQAIYKILQTERYKELIYSWNYGLETADLFGEPVSFICPELERRITEALLWDKRITAVDGFAFDFPQKGAVHVSFTAHTVFGEINAEREVAI